MGFLWTFEESLVVTNRYSDRSRGLPGESYIGISVLLFFDSTFVCTSSLIARGLSYSVDSVMLLLS